MIARRSLFRAAQLLIVAILVGYATAEVIRSWGSLRPSLAQLQPRWWLLGASAALVLVTYVLLVQVWRSMLTAWGDHLATGDALRIWFVSNLGKYVPGKVWQIGAMGALAKQSGVSPVAAVGSSLIINLVNILTGFAVVLVAGARAVEVPWLDPTTARTIAYATVAIGFAVLFLAPSVLPVTAERLGRLVGRQLTLPAIPPSVLVMASLGTAAAWVLYGVAFRLFVAGIAGGAAGATSAYLAVYTGSYLLGYLALFAPGGVGVREAALVLLMPKFALASEAMAALIAVASRLWLTVLEVLPGLLYLARGRTRRRIRTTTEDVSS